MEEAPQRAPECEFIVKNVIRSHENHPYTLAAYCIFSVYLTYALRYSSLDTCFSGAIAPGWARTRFAAPSRSGRLLGPCPPAGAPVGAAVSPLAPVRALRAAVPGAAAEEPAHAASPHTPQGGKVEGNVCRRRGQRPARPGGERRWTGAAGARCGRGAVSGGCRGRAGRGAGGG